VPVLVGAPGGQVLHGVAAFGAVVVAVGADRGAALVLRSDDAGDTWATASPSPPADGRAETMLAVSALADGSFLAVGGAIAPCEDELSDCQRRQGMVWHSIDGGLTWSALTPEFGPAPASWLESVVATESGWLAVGTIWSGDETSTRGVVASGDSSGWRSTQTLEGPGGTAATTGLHVVHGDAGPLVLGEVLTCLTWVIGPEGEPRPASGTGRGLQAWSWSNDAEPVPVDLASEIPGADADCTTPDGRQAEILAAGPDLVITRTNDDVRAFTPSSTPWASRAVAVVAGQAVTIVGTTVLTLDPLGGWQITLLRSTAASTTATLTPPPDGWPALSSATVADDRIVAVGTLDTHRPGESDVLVLVGGPDVEPAPPTTPPTTATTPRRDLRNVTLDVAGPVDLTGADLTGATLRVTGDVDGVILRGVLLDGTTITGSYATPGPHRLAADLSGATIASVSVFNLDLTGTTAKGALVTGPVFVSAVDSRCPDGVTPVANTCQLDSWG
jgi:hypothetical protein